MEKNNINYRSWFVYLILAVAFIINPFFGFKALSQESQFGYHALKINGQFVSTEIFHEEQNRFFMRWRRTAAMLRKSDEERNDMLLDEIIDRVAVEDYLYHRAKVTVTPGEVDNYINRYIKTRYSTIEEMNGYLSDSNLNGMDDLKKSIDLYLRKLKCFSKVAGELGLTIPPAELDEQYQHHVADNRKAVVRHIQISNPDPEKEKQQAEDVYQQLKNGADFGKLAAQYSADAESKTQGGELQPISKDEAIPEVAKNVFTAKAGELIPPFLTTQGYEIVLVEKFIDFSHPKAEFAKMMLIEKFGDSDQYKKWLAGIESKMTIEIQDPAMKAYRFYRNGQYNQAGALYEKVYASGNFEFNLTRAIESYEMAKNWKKLIDLGQFGMNKFPPKVSYYLDKAEGLYRSGNVKAGLDVMKRAEDLAADNLYYLNIVSQMYSTLGLENEATRVRHKMQPK